MDPSWIKVENTLWMNAVFVFPSPLRMFINITDKNINGHEKLNNLKYIP